MTIASAMTLATGPVSWGVDFTDAPANPPWELVLDQIAASGLRAIELGPLGYLPEDPFELRGALSSRGLTAIGSFLFEDLHDPASAGEILVTAEKTCRAIANAGGELLVIIDRPGAHRAPTAGRSRAARRLGILEWKAMLRTIESVGRVALGHGLRPVVHPHAGSYIEFEDEISRLMAESELELCLDTGHLAYGGLDPAVAVITYGGRIAHLHLKDLSADVLARARRERLTFWEAIAAGVFCPLGSGTVNLKALASALGRVGYSGFATIEQDRTPGSEAPLDDLRSCIEALHAAGLGSPATESEVVARGARAGHFDRWHI